MHGFSNVAAARLLMGQRVTLGVLGDTGQIPQSLPAAVTQYWKHSPRPDQAAGWYA